MAAKQAAIGHIVQVIGPVVDVKFDSEKALPEIFNALRITSEGYDIADPSTLFARCNSTWAKIACAPSRCNRQKVWCGE